MRSSVVFICVILSLAGCFKDEGRPDGFAITLPAPDNSSGSTSPTQDTEPVPTSGQPTTTEDSGQPTTTGDDTSAMPDTTTGDPTGADTTTQDATSGMPDTSTGEPPVDPYSGPCTKDEDCPGMGDTCVKAQLVEGSFCSPLCVGGVCPAAMQGTDYGSAQCLVGEPKTNCAPVCNLDEGDQCGPDSKCVEVQGWMPVEGVNYGLCAYV